MVTPPNDNSDSSSTAAPESNGDHQQPTGFGWRDWLSVIIGVPLAIKIAPLAIKHLEVEPGWEVVSWIVTIVLTCFAVNCIVAGKNGFAIRSMAEGDQAAEDDHSGDEPEDPKAT